MVKWGYKTIILDAKPKKVNTVKSIEEECDKLGEEGWELVNFQNYDLATKFMLVFKRVKED